MGLWNEIKGLYLEIAQPPKAWDEVEIDRVRRALRRHEAKVDAMSDEWARKGMPCCPSCAFGYEYTVASEQCIRTGRWLKTLLRKRGRPEDLREVEALDVDYPETFGKAR